MAIVKEVEKSIKAHQYVYDSIAYVLSPENRNGDEKCFQVTCLNCVNDSVDSLSKQFYVTRRAYNKDDNVLAHHYIQSFSPNEKITPELAHRIGVELAEKIASGFQVVVSTHIDKDHIHNHIIINSVSMVTGMKWKGNGNTLNQSVRPESDKLCRQYGLTTIKKKSGLRGIDQATQKLAEKGQSWKVDLCKALDEAVRMCHSKKEFISFMKNKGFEITRYTDRHITFQKIGETKKIRADTLAEQFCDIYKKENLEKMMGFYRPPKQFEQPPPPKFSKSKSPFISEFEKYEKYYFSKHPPLAKKEEIKTFQNFIKNSHHKLLALLTVILKLFIRRKRKSVLDKKYLLLHRYCQPQQKYQAYVPSLREQVAKLEKLKTTAGNIPYQNLISAQGENYRVRLSLSAVPKLYAYPFFFSARLYNDYALVTIKEKDKQILQKALETEEIQILEKHNRYYKPKSEYAALKKRAEMLGSKIEFLMIEPTQLERLKDETDRFVQFEAEDKIRLAFLSENKNFILHALYPDKYKQDDLFSVGRNSKVNTKLKSEALLNGQQMRYRTLTRTQVEQLFSSTENEELFAVFHKADGKKLDNDTFNIAYKESDAEKIENALNTPNAIKRKN